MRYVGNAARLAVLLFLTTGGRELFAQGAPVTTWRDLEYARAEGVSLTLDVYVPSGSGPFPLIVWIHGGGWISGDKALAAQSAQVRQTARGYVVASINYRLSGQAKFPAQSHDCKAAIRWLRANATLYKIDPARIGVWGG
ncbi:MAG: alpha/beta hydrolase, partial [Thermoanaerobaculia bacterium]|nr:alpha/beta hydrolase [Thermoanaerobaculia bacterium]